MVKRATVPEASIHKECDPCGSEDEIRSADQWNFSWKLDQIDLGTPSKRSLKFNQIARLTTRALVQLKVSGQFIKVSPLPTPTASLRLIGAEKNETPVQFRSRSHRVPSFRSVAPHRTK